MEEEEDDKDEEQDQFDVDMKYEPFNIVAKTPFLSNCKVLSHNP